MPQLAANCLHMEYETFGNPEDEPLLLIMGLGTQMTAWPVDFCEALAKRGLFVIRFDNRDVGLSSKFDGMRAPSRLRYALNHFLKVPIRPPYTLEDMAADAAGVLEALDIPSAHIAGASMGGMIAQLVAAGHPQRVRSLVSIMSTSGDPNLPKPRPEVWHHAIVARPDGSDRDSMVRHLTKSLQLIGSPGFPRSEAEFRDLATAALNRSFYPQGFTRQLAAIVADGSRVRRLKKIKSPTLVIHGRDDPLVPVEGGIDTARHIPGARLEIIDGMGHDIPPQLIDRLATLIADHAHATP